MVASKLSRLVTGRASKLARDVCRSAAILKMQGGAVITITSDASDELPPLLRVQFYAGFLPALGDLLYSHPLAITTSNHPPTTDTKHMRPKTYCLDREAAHVCPPQAAWRHQEWVRETHPAQAPAVPVKRSPQSPQPQRTHRCTSRYRPASARCTWRVRPPADTRKRSPCRTLTRPTCTSHVPGVGRGASNTSTGLMSENLASQPQLRQPLLEWCAWWHACGRMSRTCNQRHIPTHGSVEAKKNGSANTAVTSPVSCALRTTCVLGGYTAAS